MFSEMRSAVNIPKEIDILDYIHGLPDQEQQEAFAAIQVIERRAMANQVPQAGLVTLMEYLDRKRIKKGICTRNFDAPVTNLLSKHIPSHINPFSPIITRDFRPPKPSPAGILHIAHAWDLVESASIPESSPEERLLPLLMVGDSVDDIVAGYEAGALTVLLRSEGKEELERDGRTDVVISRYVRVTLRVCWMMLMLCIDWTSLSGCSIMASDRSGQGLGAARPSCDFNIHHGQTVQKARLLLHSTSRRNREA